MLKTNALERENVSNAVSLLMICVNDPGPQGTRPNDCTHSALQVFRG